MARDDAHATALPCAGSVPPIDAWALVQAGAAVLVDVRSAEERRFAGHGDPAARSVDEVLLCCPGIHAMIHHGIAHKLYSLGVPLLARLVPCRVPAACHRRATRSKASTR